MITSDQQKQASETRIREMVERQLGAFVLSKIEAHENANDLRLKIEQLEAELKNLEETRGK